MSFYDGYGNTIETFGSSNADIFGMESVTEEVDAVYCPFNPITLQGFDVTYEEWKNNIDINYFFSAPAIQPQNEGSELELMVDIIGTYGACNHDGLESGRYFLYVPVNPPNSSISIMLSSKSTLSEIYEDLVGGETTYTKTKYTYGSYSTILSCDDTGWMNGTYAIGVYMFEFYVPEGQYGYVLPSCTFSRDFKGKDWENYYHISKTPIKDAERYIDNTKTSFDQSLTVEKTVYKGSSYPLNTWGKTYCLGGDSSVSYGQGNIMDALKERCGMNGINMSVAGSCFTGDAFGGGMYFRNYYHNLGGYPDVVLLCWGGNNDSGGLGSIDADYMEDGETTPTTTLGALRCIVEDIRTLSPNTTIIGWIQYQRNNDNSYDWEKTRWESIREAYKLLSIPFVDAYYEAGIVRRDWMNYDGGGLSSDLAHPSDFGKKRIAELIANTVIRYA